MGSAPAEVAVQRGVVPGPGHGPGPSHGPAPGSAGKEPVNSVVFSLKNQVGGLARALQVFQDLGVNVVHIESRQSARRPSEAEIMVDVECDNKRMEQLVHMLRREVSAINLTACEDSPAPHPMLSAAPSFGESPRALQRFCSKSSHLFSFTAAPPPASL